FRSQCAGARRARERSFASRASAVQRSMQLRIAFVVAFAVVSAACGGQASAPRQPPPMQVPAVTLSPTEIVESSEYLAQLRARNAAALRPQVEGQVTAILVEPGQRVEAGTPLVRIDPGRQAAAVAQASAARASR